MLATIGAFVFTPELWRLVQWRANAGGLNVFTVIPLVMLCPIAILALRRRSRMRSKAFHFVMIAWSAGFVYAAFLAFAYGMVLQALYAFGEFCLPIAVGAWLLTRDETMEITHARLARALLLFGAVASVYGIFQYIVAPPWDTAWILTSGGDSFGEPERFGIRVFGVLNGPGAFALFIGAVIVFTLPYLRVRSWLNIAALLVMIVALLLSQVRTAWLVVVLGIVVCVFLSPKRFQALSSLAITIIVCVIGGSALLLALPDASAGDKIAQRFSTFSNVQEDGSALARQQTTENAMTVGLNAPAGSGLGLTGQAEQLGSADGQVFRGAPGLIDNGFASRFLEMGLPGFAAFLIANCGAIFVAFRAYAEAARRRDQAAMRVGASCIAALVVIFAVNLSGDGQQGLLGVLFFVALALPLMRSNMARSVTVASRITFGPEVFGSKAAFPEALGSNPVFKFRRSS